MADSTHDKRKRGGKQKDVGAASPPSAKRKPAADKPAKPAQKVVARSAASKPAKPPAPKPAASTAKTRTRATAGSGVGKAAAPKNAAPKPAAAKPAAAKAAPTKRSAVKPSRVKPSPVTATPAKAAREKPRGGKPPAARTAAKARSAGSRAAAAATATAAKPAAVPAGAAKAAPGRPAPKKPGQATRRRPKAQVGAPGAVVEPTPPAESENLAAASATAQAAEGTVLSEWPPKVEATPTAKAGDRSAKVRVPAAATDFRRSRRGLVVAGLVALLVGVVLAALTLGLPLPGAKTQPTPSSGGWTWLVIGAVVIGVFLVGAAIATSRKKGWRWIVDTRVVGLVAALLLVCVGLTQLFPPGASFDVGELPSLAGNALQGIGAQPEPGYPRIRISRVSIDLLLVKGDGKTPPVKYEAFTFPDADHLLAANSDGTGNSYVYAHARNGMFWRLHDLRIGDVVEVDYGNNKVYKYRVSELHPSINWRDLSWLQPTSDDRLTLQTCNGWKDDDPRFIVVARRVTDQTTTSQ